MPYLFPPIEEASPDGLLAIGGDINAESLLTAYGQGIFPWPCLEDGPLTWFSPDPRGVLFLKKFHLSNSFKKFLKHHPYEVTFNHSFNQVINYCSTVHKEREKGTWITLAMQEGYQELFERGFAYSVEVWKQKNLVGGLYGVKIGNYFSGESMFHLEDNCSKLALYSLCHFLEENSVEWIDTQMVTPILATFGAESISRSHFLKLLICAIEKKS